MARTSFDVIVLGLGAMGSAAVYHLASRGARVLGIEQFTPAHEQGSSHGGSRIIRQAYFEGPDYIPLVLRAYELWRKLEADSGTELLHNTGGLTLGSSDGELISRTVAAARAHSIPYERFDAAEVRRRFPPIAPLAGDAAVLEPHAGYLLPEACIRAHLNLAERAGAELQFEEKVLEWSAGGGRVSVRSSKRTYEAGHLVIAAGPWANEALRDIFALRVTRQVVAWIAPRDGVRPFLPERFPVFLMEQAGGRPGYGVPALDGPSGGMKVAVHGSDDVCTPGTVERTIRAADIERIRQQLSVRIPALLHGELLRAQTCLYTTTPDENFVIGAHPQAANCTVACGFSGHGFKFAGVVGEVLADLATTGTTRHPIGLFDPARLRG
ncbi:MAG TPA: N-methyl-L-tryptophan oxidase [Acidobacteriaceae bacterium]|nr:N-methyl-L-tryptophan oxidase [Acidobacteriaceae bacterium]